MFYKRNSDGPLGYAYTIGFWVQKQHTTAILHRISAETVVY